MDGASELPRPVRLRDAAGFCWCGGVPQGLQGGRGAGPRHCDTHTHTHTHTVDILIVKLLIKHRFSEDKSFCTDLVSCLLSLFVPLV